MHRGASLPSPLQQIKKPSTGGNRAESRTQLKALVMSNSSSLKSKAIAREQKRAESRKDDRTGFTTRNYWLFVLFAWLILPVATVMSVCTEGFNYYHTWASPISEDFRIIPVLLLAGVVNAVVIMFGKGIVDDVQDAVLSGEAFDRAAFALKVIIFSLAVYWSVSQSLAGAPLARTYMKETRQPVTALLADLDTVDAEYAERRQQQLDIIASARKTTWKGRITGPAMKSLNGAQQELKKIDDQVTAGRNVVATANAEIEAAYEAELTQDQAQAGVIMAGGQFMMLVSVIFIGLWYTGVEDEMDKTTGAAAGAGAGSGSGGRNPIGFGGGLAPTSHNPTPPAGGTPNHNLPAPRRQIGFGRNTPTPPAGGGTAAPPPPAGGNPPVATRSYGAETADPESLEARSRLAAWTKHNAQMNAYRAKKETPSALAGIDRQQELMNHEEQELARMGMRIELQESPRKVYILLPL